MNRQSLRLDVTLGHRSDYVGSLAGALSFSGLLKSQQNDRAAFATATVNRGQALGLAVEARRWAVRIIET
jgi:hypothetical protein